MATDPRSFVAHAQPAARRATRWTTVAGAVGDLLVTVGLVALLFVGYELFVTDLITGQRQEELSDQLHEQWATERGATPARPSILGDAFAVLHVPALGDDYERVVLEGTAEEQLRQGPGHYAGTALPGQQGNMALAGHRVGKGSPFLDLDKLLPGDPIVVETADSWFVYRVLGDPASGQFTGDPSGIPGQEVVRPTELDVISPTPGARADAPATGAYLTLTTCHPKFSARQRLVIHARLDGAGIPKADQPAGPAALYEH